jgi:hypothetical protein
LSTPTTTSFTVSYTGSDVGTTVITSETARGAYVFNQVAALPGVPIITNVTAGSAQAVVTWTAPSSGSASITDYVIQLSADSGTWTAFNDGTRTATNATVTGLSNGTAYRFRVAAVTRVGTGSYSSARSAVTPGSVSTTTTLAPSTSAPVSNTPSTDGTAVAPVSTGTGSQGSSNNGTVPSGSISVSGGAAVVTTSTVASLSPTTTTIPVPEAPAAEPGEAGALVDGEIQKAVVTRLNNALNVEVGGVTASIWGLTSQGTRVDLDETGNLRLGDEDSVVIEAGGFEPGQEIEVWMFSTPSQLGVLTAGTDGKISGTFPLPNNVPAGDHRIVLEGPNSLGQNVTLGVGLFVGKPMGDGVSPWVIWVPVTLAVSLGLIIPTTLRRRRRTADTL